MMGSFSYAGQLSKMERKWKGGRVLDHLEEGFNAPVLGVILTPLIRQFYYWLTTIIYIGKSIVLLYRAVNVMLSGIRATGLSCYTLMRFVRYDTAQNAYIRGCFFTRPMIA